jgi:hypothetical protein
MSKAIVIRVAGNMECPAGFTQEGVATRRTKLCVKMSDDPLVDAVAVAATLPAPAPAPPMDPRIDDLEGLMAGLTMNQPFVVDVDQLSALMGGLGMSGGRRRHRLSTRRKGASHRKSHRKSHHKSHRKSRKN